MTSKIQGFRKRRTGPHLLNRRLARSGLSFEASLWASVNQVGYVCNGFRRVGREPLTAMLPASL
jgi:hypothetical protein